MRTVEKLSAAKVRTLKKAGTFADGNNLYLVVDESGSRRWMYRYYAAGRRHEIGGGNTSKRSLADARAWAAGLGRLRLEGKDPIAEVRRTRGRAARDAAKAMSFKTAALSFIEVKSPEWKGWKSSQQWTNSLRDYVFPIFGHVDVSEIDTPLVMAALQPHWTAKPVTMDRVRQRIALIMDWAVTAGHRQPGPNPAAWRGHLANLLPSKAKMHRVEHLAALDYRQLPEVMARLRKKYNGFAAKALEFAILSAARSNEVVGARWDEIHFPDAIWEIPAARTKSNRPHRVALSPVAVNLLQGLPRIAENDFVFPGLRRRQHLTGHAMLEVLRRLHPTATVHATARSCFRVWAAEATLVPAEIAELCLGHRTASEVQRAYQRSDLIARRAKLMRDWAEFLERPTPEGDVVPIRGAASGGE